MSRVEMLKLVLITICFLGLTNGFTFNRTYTGKACLPNDMMGCTCKFTDGSGIVDLSSLGNTDGTPRFKDIPDPNGQDTYSYSACNGFTVGKCQNAAVCMTSQDQQIGDAGNTLFGYEEASGRVTAAYAVKKSVLMVSEVEMICDETACEPKLEAQGQASVGNFKFQLTSICACPNMCTSAGPSNCSKHPGTASGGLGVGTLVLIGLVCLIAVYLIVGFTYTKVKLKATGSDVMPNKQFWTSLPGLIKDGTSFAFSKCTSKKFKYENV